MQISIAFDPKKDSAADVQAALLRFYATVNGTQLADAAIGGTVGSDPADDESKDTAANPAQLDKDGIPWNAEIHSETPTITAKGFWRKRKGVDATTYKAKADMLRAQLGTSITTHTTGVANTPAPTAGALPGLTQQPLPGLGALQTAAPIVDEYTKLMQLVIQFLQTPNNPAGVLSEAQLNQWVSALAPTSGGQINFFQQQPAEVVRAAREQIAKALGAPFVA